LFVGDNVETPIPYLNEPDLATYIASLNLYLELDWNYLVAGHDPLQSNDLLVRENIEYLEGVAEWSIDMLDLDTQISSRHIMNLAEIAGKLPETAITSAMVEHYQQAVIILESRERTDSVKEILSKLAIIAKKDKM
jgi:hypothetical protein